MRLYAHHRLVTSPFGLLGTDENALSFALAYTFQQCPPLLHWFLGQIGISGVRGKTLEKARIELQSHREAGQGITDIEIRLDDYFHVIVEAKVGLAVPSLEQCQKYLTRFDDKKDPKQKLVALVESPDTSFIKRYKKVDPRLAKLLVLFPWSDLLPECLGLVFSDSVKPESKHWVRSFYRFLDQEYRMKAFTTEVWILPVETTQPLWKNGMTFWEIHQKYNVYWDSHHPTVRPLYLGFRVNGMLDGIYRVNKIEYERPIIEVIPELKELKEEWPKDPYTIWHYGPRVPLPTPLQTGAGMYSRRVRSDLDLLLTCKTVKQVEEQMGKRGMQPEA